MSLTQLLKFKKWETRLFKMPRMETPRFQTGKRVTVASGLRAVDCVWAGLLRQSKNGFWENEKKILSSTAVQIFPEYLKKKVKPLNSLCSVENEWIKFDRMSTWIFKVDSYNICWNKNSTIDNTFSIGKTINGTSLMWALQCIFKTNLSYNMSSYYTRSPILC